MRGVERIVWMEGPLKNVTLRFRLERVLTYLWRIKRYDPSWKISQHDLSRAWPSRK